MTVTATDVRVIELVVEAALRDAAGNEGVKLMAYAFSSGGQLVDSAPIDEKGNAALKLAVGSDPQEIKVMVGPAQRAGDEKQTVRIADLHRQGAEEQVLRVDQRSERAVARFEIFPEIWHCWLRGLYFVRGEVVKRLGTTDLPIVGATVEIYEVDPIWIILPRLPDYVIEDIRRIIIDPIGPIEERFPRPIPPRPPIDVLRPLTLELAPATHADHRHVEAAALPATATMNMSALPSSLQFAAHNASTFQLRQELTLNPAIMRYLLCFIHPQFVTKQLVATVHTNRCGEFRALASQGCSSDTPDLYFVVKQHVFPLLPLITIYGPTPVACYTYWNYVSGSDVTIVVTHPLAIASPPCPDHVIPNLGVVVEAIGNIELSAIYGTSNTDPAPLPAALLGLTHDGQPWGGTLRLRLDFDPALRDHGIRYYRVGYRKGTTGLFTDLDLPIRRIYRTFGTVPPVETTILLGPQPVGTTAHLYEIPPALPPVPDSTWAIKDLFEDTIHAKFATALVAPGIPHASAGPDNAGMYQLRVDMFDASGNAVDLVATGVQFYVPTVGDPTAAAGLGLIDGNSFVMALHVDNNPCFAQIDTPVDQDGDPAGTECGVIDYARDALGNKLGTVAMRYTAAHRNGFARYTFRLYRGANERTLPGLPVVGAAVSLVPFTNVQMVAALLDTCAVAGFSENLYVNGLATDGLSGDLGYDASAVFAFALAPEGTGA